MEPLTKALAAQSVIGEAKLIELSVHLIKYGARPQVLVALTGLPEKKARQLIRSSTGAERLPKGPMQFPTAEFFVGSLRKRNHYANLQSTLFLSRYLILRDETFTEPMHEGFLLAMAFQGYLDILEQQRVAGVTEVGATEPLLDLNRAFELLRRFDGKELEMIHCPSCEAPYLALQWVERDTIACPICAKTNFKKFAAEAGRLGGRRKSA